VSLFNSTLPLPNQSRCNDFSRQVNAARDLLLEEIEDFSKTSPRSVAFSLQRYTLHEWSGSVHLDS
jgi:hypothetical protein